MKKKFLGWLLLIEAACAALVRDTQQIAATLTLLHTKVNHMDGRTQRLSDDLDAMGSDLGRIVTGLAALRTQAADQTALIIDLKGQIANLVATQPVTSEQLDGLVAAADAARASADGIVAGIDAVGSTAAGVVVPAVPTDTPAANDTPNTSNTAPAGDVPVLVDPAPASVDPAATPSSGEALADPQAAQ